jgi:serine/threonine protein kinase
MLNGKIIKIGDFGSAKHLGFKSPLRYTYNIGTLQYSAP